MAASKLRLDRPGIVEMLRSAGVAAAIEGAAESVARNVSESARNGDPIPVKVGTYVTDRAAAGVTMAHPAGLGIEAKRGSLSRAASAAGLEVNGEGAEQLLDYVTKSGKKRKATQAQVDNWSRGQK